MKIIVDGNLVARKSLYSVKLNMSDGTPVGVIYGCLNTLLNISNRFEPEKIIWCWDGSSQRRKAISADYKANRVKGEDDQFFHQQCGITDNLLTMLGIDQARMLNEEADDVIGTLATKYSKDDKVMIVSNDYDFFQLVNDNIWMYWSRRDSDIIWNRQKIKDEFGIEPQQFIDVYSISGDPTDNIKGIGKVGEKTAIKYIQEFGSVENMLETVSKSTMPFEKAKKILDSKELLLMNKQLVKIVTDLDVVIKEGKAEPDTVKAMFKDYFQFNHFLERWDEFEKARGVTTL